MPPFASLASLAFELGYFCLCQQLQLKCAPFASLAYALGDFWAFALPLLLASASKGKEKVRPFCLCVATVKSKGRHKLRCLLPFRLLPLLAFCLLLLLATGYC
jgi:hypothetical protein